MPVIVVTKEKIEEILEKEKLEILEKIVYESNELLGENLEEDYISRFRLIPFSSLGKQNGMLVGFKPDRVLIKFDGNEVQKKNVIIRNI